LFIREVEFDEASIVVRDVYQSRKALYATLHDREDIASILTNSLGVVFWFLMFLLGLTVFGVNTSSLLIPLGSAFVTLGIEF
jgi:small-conductance mechanosensitive channel